MPLTTPDGLPFESLLNDEPTRTLNGGSDGLSDILAIEVQRVLSELRTTVADLSSRVTVAESALADIRWRHISQGTHTGGAFTIPVPAGFEVLHLHLWGDLDGNGEVQLRINGDTTSALHRQGDVVQDSQTPPVFDRSQYNEDAAWYLADWGQVEGNTADVMIFETLAGNRVSYQCHGGRQATGASVQRRSWAHGRLNADRVVSSLQLTANTDAGNQFALVKWWLDGRLASP